MENILVPVETTVYIYNISPVTKIYSIYVKYEPTSQYEAIFTTGLKKLYEHAKVLNTNSTFARLLLCREVQNYTIAVAEIEYEEQNGKITKIRVIPTIRIF